MRILLAPDKFKGSMDAITVANIMEQTINTILPDAVTTLMPLADGGEGSLETFRQFAEYETVSEKVPDALGRLVEAEYLIDRNRNSAIIELSQASGLELLKLSERNPMNTSTFGTGLQIKSAIQKGAKNILLCVGGSATNDGGIGLAAALGYQFFDDHGEELEPIGKNLSRIRSINRQQILPALKHTQVSVACDVKNKLCGRSGAAYTYAPQKGANNDEVELLDNGLMNLATVIDKDLKVGVRDIPGGGAAGGVGAGSVAFLHAKLKSGARLILDQLHFNAKLSTHDWVFTGEGKIDETSFQGKLISEILNRSVQHQKSVALFGGQVEATPQCENVFFTEISPRTLPLGEALSRGEEFLDKAVRQFVRSHFI